MPVAAAIDGLISDIKEYAQNKQGETPRIILLSPILIDNTKPFFSQLYTENYNQESVEKSKALAKALKPIADKHDILFADASTVAAAGEDGIHFSEEAHGALAKLLSDVKKGQTDGGNIGHARATFCNFFIERRFD
jgi:lysophospholipase L1-like esterase